MVRLRPRHNWMAQSTLELMRTPRQPWMYRKKPVRCRERRELVALRSCEQLIDEGLIDRARGSSVVAGVLDLSENRVERRPERRGQLDDVTQHAIRSRLVVFGVKFFFRLDAWVWRLACPQATDFDLPAGAKLRTPDALAQIDECPACPLAVDQASSRGDIASNRTLSLLSLANLGGIRAMIASSFGPASRSRSSTTPR